MRFPLTTHFDELLKNICPPQERLDAARDLPPLVRAYLKNHQDFITLSPHTRLAGSYAQKMSAGDVKDVDFLLRVDGDPDDNEPQAKQLIQRLRNILDGLPAALGYEGWAGVDIERARRSVHVYIKGRDFHLDVVPCIAPEGFDKVLYVPDRGFNKWVKSHPIGYIQLLSDLNNQHGKKVKKLGRLLKHFRDYQMKTRKPKSYWLGSLLIHQIQEGELDTSECLATLFRDLLDSIYNKYACLLGRTDGATPSIPDPMLGHNISWNWSRSHFETFMRCLDEGRKWATKALDANDRETAVQYWQKVFGADHFPEDVEEAAASLATAGQPGTAHVTAAGLIVAGGLVAAAAAAASTLIRPTRFHGIEE